MNLLKQILVLVVFASISRIGAQQFELAPYLQDNLVLQRNARHRIWGRAEPKEKIEIHINGRTYSASVKKDGEWEETFSIGDTISPNSIHFYLGKEKQLVKSLRNVVAGDVWLVGVEPGIGAAVPNKVGADVRVLDFSNQAFEGLAGGKSGPWRIQTRDGFSYGDIDAAAFRFGASVASMRMIPVGIIQVPPNLLDAALETPISNFNDPLYAPLTLALRTARDDVEGWRLELEQMKVRFKRSGIVTNVAIPNHYHTSIPLHFRNEFDVTKLPASIPQFDGAIWRAPGQSKEK